MKSIKAVFYKHHKIFGLIFFIPLLLTAVTGVGLIIADEFLKNKELEYLLYKLHVMDFWGLKDIYCLFVGFSMIYLLITGIVISGIFKKITK